MNIYTFENIAIGAEESFIVTITEEMMDRFSGICGDKNPLHMEEEYAVSYGYKSRVVYGLLTASFYSTLAGMYLPGKYCILKALDLYFDHPVYIGDCLTIYGIVKGKDERFCQVSVHAKIKNQLGKTVSRAKILVGFYE